MAGSASSPKIGLLDERGAGEPTTKGDTLFRERVERRKGVDDCSSDGKTLVDAGTSSGCSKNTSGSVCTWGVGDDKGSKIPLDKAVSTSFSSSTEGVVSRMGTCKVN